MCFFWERQFYNWISYLSSQKRISWLLGWIFGWGIWVFWFQTQKLKNVSRHMGEFRDHSFFHTKKNRIQIPFGQFHALSRIAFSFPSPCRWPHLVYYQAILVIWSDFPGKLRELFLEKTTPSLAKPILACFCCNGAVFSRHRTGAIVCGSLLFQHLCLVGSATQPKMLPWLAILLAGTTETPRWSYFSKKGHTRNAALGELVIDMNKKTPGCHGRSPCGSSMGSSANLFLEQFWSWFSAQWSKPFCDIPKKPPVG